MSDTTHAAETLTDDMIRALRDQAAREGDDAMAHVCAMALGGDALPTATTPDQETARRQCAAVISDSRAQDDSRPFVRVVA